MSYALQLALNDIYWTIGRDLLVAWNGMSVENYLAVDARSA